MKSKLNLIRAIQFFFLYTLLAFTAISYHPTIVSMSRAAGMEQGTVLSRYIMLLFIGLFVLSFSLSSIRKSRFIRNSSSILLVLGIVSFTVYAITAKRTMITEVRTIFICLASVMIGWNLSLSKKGLYWIIFVFGGFALFAGLMQVLVNIGGFRIANLYLADSKNSLGAMLGSLSVALLIVYLNPPTRTVKILSLVGFILGIVIILTIRARAALVAVLALGFFCYYLRNRNKNVILVGLGTIVALALLLLFLPSSVTQYFVDSMTAGTQGVDFTSGRMGAYKEALAFLSDHILFGNIMGDHQMSWIHNYPLLQTYRYGVVFASPILFLYLYILVFCVKQSMKIGTQAFIPGFLVMLVPYIISFVEPTFPFGPGTVNVFNYLLLGISLKLVDC